MTTSVPPCTVPTSFEFPASDERSQVSIVGSWDEWSKKTPMQRKPNTNIWQVHLDLSPGLVTFKFVTNGKWFTTSSYSVEADGFGGKNNSRVISVPEDDALLISNAQECITRLTDEELPQGTNDAQQTKTDGLERKKGEEQQEANNCSIC